ncbi:hypothetical protein [Halochromatium roseum]|uniref:hypothetical protein n=1 Tax=Halochromatium roseum TaxID=391920 RepID=UPI0019120DEA|nr:hypothetical protein [Halochromatium roseum]MBK5937700.1 hypothetical protein [Halochromatium roseum]
MQRLEITTRIAADGILHLPVKAFADQEVHITVTPAPVQTASAKAPLVGADALRKAREIGFVGSFEAEVDISSRYKEHLDWSDKT